MVESNKKKSLVNWSNDQIKLFKAVNEYELLWQSDNNPWENPYETDPKKTNWTPYD